MIAGPRRFSVEIGGFVTSAAPNADLAGELEGEERMPRTARRGGTLAEMRYGCLQRFYKYRLRPFNERQRGVDWQSLKISPLHIV